MGSVRIEGSFFGGWDLFGEELRAAVQSRIDAKHEKRQLAGHDGEKRLVIVLGDTEAYWQFIHPPENIDAIGLLAALPYSLILTIEASTRCG